ncbi:MAG: MFS transporter [Stellaceae bacterium]
MRPDQWAVVGIAAFALFVDYLIYGLVIPLTPYSPALGGTEQLGLLYGGYSAGVLAATPLFGYLGNRIGYRWPMIFGVILSALTVVLFAVAANFYLLLLGRLGVSPAAVGLIFTVGSVAYGLSAPLVSRAADRFPVRTVIIGGTIAMAGQIVAEGERTGRFRPLTFIHGTANGRVHAFAEHVRALAARHPAMTVHVRYSRPDAADRLGVTHDGEGHVTLDVLKEVLPFGDYDFYLCGPPGFMQSLYDGLAGFGVRPEQIHCESFATGAALRVELLPAPRTAPGATIEGAVTVRFAKSAITAEWSRDKGTLLEFAEAQGLAPAFGCRSGICGTCATRLAGGAVEYVEEPLAARGAGEVLLCCAIPSREAGQRAGGDPALVLDL